MGPLAGLRVLDFSRALAGPYCSRLFVEAGADVWKVEPVGNGDFTRSLPPILQNGESLYFHQQNYGKRSVAVDLKSEAVNRAILAAVREADVVVENFRPGVMERLGLGFEQLAGVNSRIVMCSISGFGQQSPYAGLPGQDLAAQARSGLLDVTRSRSGEPLVPNTSLTDIVSGTFAFAGCLVAMAAAVESGRPQWLDTSILGAALQLFPDAESRSHPLQVVVASSDGYLVVDASSNHSQAGLTGISDGQPQLATGIDGDAVLAEQLRRWVATQTSAEAEKALLIRGIPARIVPSVSDVADDPRWWDCGAFRPIADIVGPAVVSTPLSLAFDTHSSPAAEVLGASTYEFLSSISGMDDDGILDLIGRGEAELTPESIPAEFPCATRGPVAPRVSPPQIRLRRTQSSSEQVAIVTRRLSDYAEQHCQLHDSSTVRVRYAGKSTDAGWQAEAFAQAETGLMDILGEEAGPPYPYAVPVLHTMAGVYGFVIGALSNADTCDIDLETVGLAAHDMALMEALGSANRTYGLRGGSERTSLVPYGVYRAGNGHIAISASGGGYGLLMAAISADPNDRRYAKLEDRRANRDGFTQMIESWLATVGDPHDAESLLGSAGVVAARVRARAEVIGDRGMFDQGFLVRTAAGAAPAAPFTLRTGSSGSNEVRGKKGDDE